MFLDSREELFDRNETILLALAEITPLIFPVAGPNEEPNSFVQLSIHWQQGQSNLVDHIQCSATA